ncbi:hypothetical protein [Myxococcus xanthus]|uniref:hypothetical protein n=1 Tax=Myxococcus xanthus TaxID=34 RepID=UPI00116235C6|nr:hypothetical protein [Myxococcus xanthus]QDF03804.1 hypothetical protein BHS04_11415 [Myxococcus xanthus]
MSRPLLVVLGVVLATCGESDAPTPDGGASPPAPDAGVPQPDAGNPPDDAGTPEPDGGSPWVTVTAVQEARVAEAGASVPGLGLAVYDAQDRKVYEHIIGDFAPDRRVAVAAPGTRFEFGWTPWADRDAGDYAVLGMHLQRDDPGAGVVSFAMRLSTEVRHLIRAALAP